VVAEQFWGEKWQRNSDLYTESKELHIRFYTVSSFSQEISNGFQFLLPIYGGHILGMLSAHFILQSGIPLII